MKMPKNWRNRTMEQLVRTDGRSVPDLALTPRLSHTAVASQLSRL